MFAQKHMIALDGMAACLETTNIQLVIAPATTTTTARRESSQSANTTHRTSINQNVEQTPQQLNQR